MNDSAATRPGKKARLERAATERAIQYVKNHRGGALTEEEKLDILVLHANVRADHSSVPRKESATNKIARLFGRSNKTVGEGWAEFIARGSVSVVGAPANRDDRMTRLPRSVEMQSIVRGFIRNRCETRTRTTAKDVMHLLIEKNYLSVDTSNTDQVNAAMRTVQRFVKKEGYERGTHKGGFLKLSPANDLARAEYVQRMTSDEADLRRIVYMDESYIHQHYARHNDSRTDPTDRNTVKPKHKGRRLCFIAAILDKDRTAKDEGRTPDQSARLLTETIDIFEGSKQTKDYHGMFCHDYFVEWMKGLLEVLKSEGLVNCLIVMDNAKYHKVLPDSVPKKGSARNKLLSAIDAYGIDAPPNATKPILWEKLSAHIKAHVVPVVVEMARKQGHDGLRICIQNGNSFCMPFC